MPLGVRREKGLGLGKGGQREVQRYLSSVPLVFTKKQTQQNGSNCETWLDGRWVFALLRDIDRNRLRPQETKQLSTSPGMQPEMRFPGSAPRSRWVPTQFCSATSSASHWPGTILPDGPAVSAQTPPPLFIVWNPSNLNP